MSETMVDVLIYLFENYMAAESVAPIDQHELEEELSQAGFGGWEIAQALRWLDELARRMEISEYRHPRNLGAMRIYTEMECRKLDVEGRGLLMSLEQNGILDPLSRELVVDRALAIDQASVSVEELKWIVLLVLMNRPGREAAFNRMEDMVYGDEPVYLH